MKVRAIRTRLKPGMEESYEQLHHRVPDELAAQLVRNGNSEWLIFRHGQDLFHVIFSDTSDDAAADRLDEASSSESEPDSLAGWHRAIAAHLVPVDGDATSAEMRFVWSLTENGGSPPNR
jgi:L-rhamnose mutarotase